MRMAYRPDRSLPQHAMADAGEKLKVFISYSRRDASEFADELVAGLELAGFAPFVWYSSGPEFMLRDTFNAPRRSDGSKVRDIGRMPGRPGNAGYRICFFEGVMVPESAPL